MLNKEDRANLFIFTRAGLPFTLIGMIIVFIGIYFLKSLFADNEYLVAILFVWLALFWSIYQPLFKRRIAQVRNGMNRNSDLSNNKPEA